MIATNKTHTTTRPGTSSYQEWWVVHDPIRQIHTSRCSEIFPTKGVQIKKCPPGNDQMFHQKGTETSPTQQVPCLSGICLFPGGYLKPTLQDNPRRKKPTQARPRPRDLRVRSWSIWPCASVWPLSVISRVITPRGYNTTYPFLTILSDLFAMVKWPF